MMTRTAERVEISALPVLGAAEEGAAISVNTTATGYAQIFWEMRIIAGHAEPRVPRIIGVKTGSVLKYLTPQAQPVEVAQLQLL